MAYSKQYDYLIFLHDSFELGKALTLENPAFLFIFALFLLYFLLIIIAIYRSKRTKQITELDDNMKKIISDYRKEILELNQNNATSFISLSTEAHNVVLRAGESYMLKSQETEMKTLPGFEDHSHMSKDIEYKDGSISNNISNLSIIQENNKSEIQKEDENKQKKTDNMFGIDEETNKQNNEKNVPAIKQLIAPPTFTDRFDIAVQNTLVKKESSPSLQKKSLTLDYTVKNPEQLNLHAKKTLTPHITKSPKFESGNKSANNRRKKRVRHNVNTKFKQLIRVSSPIYSTYSKESRFFPKHLRITLIYFEFIFCLFLTTITAIKEENSRQKNFFGLIGLSILTSFISWGVFLCLTLILTTDKQKLISAKNDDEFFTALINFEKEYKYRTFFGYFLIHFLNGLFYVQIIAFCTVFQRDIVVLWAIVNGIVFVSQHIFFDFMYYFMFSSIYVQAYDSKTFKQIYNVLKNLRVWIV